MRQCIPLHVHSCNVKRLVPNFPRFITLLRPYTTASPPVWTLSDRFCAANHLFEEKAMFTRRSLLVVIALIAFSAIGRAQNSETVIPLEGLDPVMLSQGKEVQGDMKYKV